MIKLEDIQKVYMIGIGGIGMSAIARYFAFHGRQVSGYDKTETRLTKELTVAGISVTYDDSETLAPKDVDLVVYTPAIPASHPQLAMYKEMGVALLKRSEVLGLISNSSYNICVAGTHGKTTISTMIAHLLTDTGYGANAFLGGISVNYNTNFLSDEHNVCVIEADEYDRSFLRLSPDIAVISSMDADHLDIYGDEASMEEAFLEFSRKLKSEGTLLTRFGLKRSGDFKTKNHLTYSLQNEGADIHATNIRMKDGAYQFDVMMKGNLIDNLTLNMGGMHNVENAIAAISVASLLNIENKKVRASIASFRGVKRRFEYIVRSTPLTYIDDYAHHPEELRALITGAKALFHGSRMTVIFQPHLFSRTRDFAKEFAETLDLADEVMLLPIYPAREMPMEGVTSNLVLAQMKKANRKMLTKEAVLEYISNNYLPQMQRDFGAILITAGAGDIDTLVSPIKSVIENSGRVVLK